MALWQRARSPCWRCRRRARLAGVKLDPKTREAFRAFGRQGGKIGGPKGGASRMAKLTAEERRALAKKAAKALWRKKKGRKLRKNGANHRASGVP